MSKVLDKYHQILIKKSMKAAPDISSFFFTQVKVLGHVIENTTITTLKSQIDAIWKLQPKSTKKKIQELFRW